MTSKTLPFLCLFRKCLRFLLLDESFLLTERESLHVFFNCVYSSSTRDIIFLQQTSTTGQDRMGRDIVFFPGCIVPYSYYNSRSLFSIKNENPSVPLLCRTTTCLQEKTTTNNTAKVGMAFFEHRTTCTVLYVIWMPPSTVLVRYQYCPEKIRKDFFITHKEMACPCLTVFSFMISRVYGKVRFFSRYTRLNTGTESRMSISRRSY